MPGCGQVVVGIRLLRRRGLRGDLDAGCMKVHVGSSVQGHQHLVAQASRLGDDGIVLQHLRVDGQDLLEGRFVECFCLAFGGRQRAVAQRHAHQHHQRLPVGSDEGRQGRRPRRRQFLGRAQSLITTQGTHLQHDQPIVRLHHQRAVLLLAQLHGGQHMRNLSVANVILRMLQPRQIVAEHTDQQLVMVLLDILEEGTYLLCSLARRLAIVARKDSEFHLYRP